MTSTACKCAQASNTQPACCCEGQKKVNNIAEVLAPFTKFKPLVEWVEEYNALCQPMDVVVVTGSQEQKQEFLDKQVADDKLIKLSKRSGSYLARSDPGDVARVEKFTYICCKNKEDAGPTNNWVEPSQMRKELNDLYRGCMQGRTMYVIPYSMGPFGSALSENGIQLSDNPYVALSMLTMTRVSTRVFQAIEEKGTFVKGVQTAGMPLKPGQQDVKWPCNADAKRIVQFPETREICTFGSSYGGNALLGKKCFALRIASVLGRDEGWLAEHMLIIGVTNPAGKKRYFAAAFPSACGKTNMALMIPTRPGWKVETVGDDIAWMKFGKDGRLYAINPEYGMFGVAPGTSMKTNAHAMECCSKDSLFTNVALTADGDVWWEDMTDEVPEGMTDWLGKPYDKTKRDPKKEPAAHKNSRFCVPLTNCPIMDPEFDLPNGVPISALFFGGRRPTTVPLVYEAKNWSEGVFIGSSISSESTAAAADMAAGELNHDPFAMRPFCGYHMGDYWGHWLDIGHNDGVDIAPKGVKKILPKIYGVNWFRTGPKNKYLWPGFGDNCRVVEWAFQRCDEADAGMTGAGESAVEAPIGYLPKHLDLEGLDMSDEDFKNLMKVDPKEWSVECAKLEKYYEKIGKVPEVLRKRLAELKKTFAAQQ